MPPLNKEALERLVDPRNHNIIGYARRRDNVFYTESPLVDLSKEMDRVGISGSTNDEGVLFGTRDGRREIIVWKLKRNPNRDPHLVDVQQKTVNVVQAIAGNEIPVSRISYQQPPVLVRADLYGATK